jgi:hypothetical protein
MPVPTLLGWTAPGRDLIDGAFVFCTDCYAVHRVNRSDRAPVYLSDGTPTLVDDCERFLAVHRDHRLQVLSRSSDAEMISHPRWDPMCRVMWDVSDGETDFVVTFGRTDIEAPREYVVTPGRMVLERESVEVDEDALRRTIDEALYPHAAPVHKIDALIQTCRRLVLGTPSDELELLDESRDEPNVQLAGLPRSVAEPLREKVRELFSEEESEGIFAVLDHDLRYDIPVVRLIRRYRIEPLD